MASVNEKIALLEIATPRPSLSSVRDAPPTTIKHDLGTIRTFIEQCKKLKWLKNGRSSELNNAILQHIIVDLSERKYGPDLVVKTDGKHFRGHLTLEGSMPRTADVQLTSTNSHIACNFPIHAPGQLVHMQAVTVHGSVKVGLPRDFDGFICLETLVGNTTKTSTLRAHSTPAINHNKKLNCKTFRVRPTLAVDRKNKANYLDMDEHKQNFDFCRVVSYGGLVEIGYMDEMDALLEVDVKEAASGTSTNLE